MSVNFFTPITFAKESHFKERLLESVDDYFYLGGRRALVLTTNERELRVKVVEGHDALLKRALKIASYATVVIPLTMLILKVALRSQYRVHRLDENESAIKIQSLWRSYRVQKRVRDEFSQWKHYIDDPEKFGDCYRPIFGITEVYFPPNSSFVIKRCGEEKSRDRFRTSALARQFCKDQGYHHLVVPKSRVYQDCVVEKRLPLKLFSLKEQIGLYIEQRDKFTEAVKEFTHFICQTTVKDIVGETTDCYQALSEFSIGRYDNVSLYFDNEEGKVGLLDLENFSMGLDRSDECWCVNRCIEALHLFPHHLDEILEIAKAYDPNIDDYRSELEGEKEQVLESFETIYLSHKNFLQANQINFDNPLEILPVHKERRAVISRFLKSYLNVCNTKRDFKGLLGSDPATALNLFEEKVLPILLCAVQQFIDVLLKDNLRSYRGRVETLPALLSIRSLEFTTEYPAYKVCLGMVMTQLSMFHFPKQNKLAFLSLLVKATLKTMVGKEICLFKADINNPLSEETTHLIFC